MNLKHSMITAAVQGIACLAGACLVMPSWANDAAPTPREAAPVAGEPAVKRTVIEDGGSRVEELRVRGQTQRITVTPKVGGMKPYEIIGSDGSRDLQEAPDATRGASGKRVWHVLSF